MSLNYFHLNSQDLTFANGIQRQLPPLDDTEIASAKPSDTIGAPLLRHPVLTPSGSKTAMAPLAPVEPESDDTENCLQPADDLAIQGGPLHEAYLDLQEEIIMRTGKSLLGLSVVGQADGAALGKVRDLIFSPETDQVIALVLGEKDLFGMLDAQIVPWKEIQSVGQDTVFVRNAASNIRLKDYPMANEASHERETVLSGTQLLTADGQRLGTLADTCIDEVTGQIVGYEVSGGFIADTLHGKKFLPSPPALSVSGDAAIVPPEAASLLK